MQKKIISCPYKKVTLKHGTEPDLFGIFESTFKWCKVNSTGYFNTKFIEPGVVEITFTSPNGCDYLINVLTEYIARHTFVKAIDNIVNQTGVEISDVNKERTYTMCINIVSNFLESADILLNWSLHRFFQNNDTINISIYEKLNLKPLRSDFEAILNQPHSLNYIFDSFERIISTNGVKDEQFLLAGLMTKSIVESKPVFCFPRGDSLSVWIDNGKITFGSAHHQFGVKDIIGKELYEQGFHPQKDMISTKIVALAVMFVCPEKLILYKGLNNKGIEKFLDQYKGVFGELDIELSEKDCPDFGGAANE